MSSVLNLDRIRQLIEQKYRSQAAFAKALGVSRQYLSQVLKGAQEPSLERFVQMADLLEVTVDELLGKDHALVRAAA